MGNAKVGVFDFEVRWDILLSSDSELVRATLTDQALAVAAVADSTEYTRTSIELFDKLNRNDTNYRRVLLPSAHIAMIRPPIGALCGRFRYLPVSASALKILLPA